MAVSWSSQDQSGEAMDEQQSPVPGAPSHAWYLAVLARASAMPAVANALVDALSVLGVKHVDMPATPEVLWRAIREARGKNA